MEEEITYCAIHPDRETALRCNKCERYMCAQCAVSTPVGYRCRECVRQVEDKFFDVTSNDYLIILGISLGLSVLGGLIASAVNFLILSFFLGIIWSGVVSEACLRAINRRKGRNSGQIAVGGVLLGGLIGAALQSVFVYNDRFGRILAAAEQAGVDVSQLPRTVFIPMSEFVLSNMFSLGVLVFIGLTAFAVYTRMKA